MPVSFIGMPLDDLRSSRAPKYDVMFKMVFSLEGSSLRRILSIPKGLGLSEQFPDMDGLEIDSLTLGESSLHHLEFQAKNHGSMLERMFKYKAKIADRPDIKSLRSSGSFPLEQTVLYVGKPEMNMRHEYKRHDEILFSFKLNDIREFHAERNMLESSEYPEDWALSLLVANDGGDDDEAWLFIAAKMNEELDQSDPSTAEFRTILLISSILREVDRKVQEEISDMIEIDVSRNRLLRQVFEQGMDNSYPLFLMRQIRETIQRNELDFEESRLEELEGGNLDELSSFANQLTDAADKQDFLDRRRLTL